MEYVSYLLTGMVAGLCAGLFGVGGGLVIVPILVWVFTAQAMNADVISHVALGTSLATIIITSLSSMSAHHKRGGVRWAVFRNMAWGLVLGSVVGAYIAKLIKSDSLQIIIGVGACLMAIKMLFIKTSENPNKTLPSPIIQSVAGGIIGGTSAIFGIGGGSLTVPFLTNFGLPMKQAVGTSAACGLPIAAAGAAAFVFFGQNTPTGVAGTVGFVHIWAFLCICIMSFMSAKIGANLAHKLPANLLKKGFGGLLLLVGIKLVIG